VKRENLMIETIERMLTDLERGKLTRRQFAVSLATLAAGSLAAPGAVAAPPAAPTGFRAVSVNHITVKVSDLHRTSRFYQEFFQMPLRQQSATTHILGVGNSFFGIEQGDNQPASVSHFDFGIENFNADAIRARLTELNLKFSGTSKESFKFNDPDGFLVQVNGPDYVGHV
jgi:catechol 2,3-dioxygenase-like lactoylglutathione lyase family enzyme